jgi:ribonuclease-3
LRSESGYTYKDKSHALNALIHSSYANELNGAFSFKNNERLEFLGDAILDFAMGMMLYNNNPDMSEGEMSKTRALIVCEASLAACAQELGIGELVFSRQGRRKQRWAQSPFHFVGLPGGHYREPLSGWRHGRGRGFIVGLLGETYQKPFTASCLWTTRQPSGRASEDRGCKNPV